MNNIKRKFEMHLKKEFCKINLQQKIQMEILYLNMFMMSQKSNSSE